MRHTQRAAVWSCLALLVAGPPAYFPTLPNPRITFENYRRLKHGMEVEGILGVPPGDYGGGCRTYAVNGCEGRTCDVLYSLRYRPYRPPPTAEEIAEAERHGVAVWWGREYAVAVQFDGQGKAVATGCGRAYREPTWWDDLREAVGW